MAQDETTPAGSATAASEQSPIRLGIAGLGLAGALMIRAAAVHPKIKLWAGADPLPRPREAFARDFGAMTHADFGELCADPAIEAIYIATPHELHAEQAIEAMAHRKHVLVEKPLALTIEDCDAVIDAADHAAVKLIVGHTHGFDRNIQAVARLVRSGELGRLGMIVAFNYTDFLYRPRRPEELDTRRGGGIVFNQVMHQIEIVRLIGGGLVRSVRANAGILDPARPTEGNCVAFLEFENGAAASVVYSAYDFFDSDELHGWVAEGGTPKVPRRQGETRRRLMTGARAEADLQQDLGYGGRRLPADQLHMPHFGTVIVTCERGDVRLSADGMLIYGLDTVREIAVERGPGWAGQGDALDALWGAVRQGRSDVHDARWGRASLEVALAILQSARERREISLVHQMEVRD
jgi:phthalate 4,5-cis-dihydrodiol dehydrogenase